jgi:hypothetical protein
MENQNKTYTPEDIEKFVMDHIQSKIDNHELGMVGFDMAHIDNFKREFEIYKNTLFEGVCNGILMCGGKIEGIYLE